MRVIWFVGSLLVLFGGTVSAIALPSQKGRNKVSVTKKKRKQWHFRTLKYDLFFKGKKTGYVSQQETFLPNGDILVVGKSVSVFRILFFKVDTKSSFRSLFRKGKLFSYSFKQVQRGKHLQISAKRTAKGFRVVHIQQGKKRVRVFPFSSFDATSHEYRVPLRPKGSLLKRNILHFVKFKVIPQTLSFQKKQRKKIAGKEWLLSVASAKEKRSSVLLFFNQKGALIESIIKIPMLGESRIRLRSVAGKPLSSN